MGSDKNIW